ncbi:hypothetical protein [Alteromonas macleodii]|uniref:hypothetical protein n=1 Tax=Alteromonas macleodii TaxID=28108 RepID=UPI00313B4DE3|tara:strand:+ start:279 stop:461 length:183 start_codon:yes stop_codon:yes gene_type:complete
MIGTTRKKYLNVLKKLREDSDLTKEQKEAVEYAITVIKARPIVRVAASIAAIFVKYYLDS